MRMAPRDHSSAVKGGAAQSGRTGWHSAAASALEATFKKPTISRAKRSAAMPGWTAPVVCTAFGCSARVRVCPTFTFGMGAIVSPHIVRWRT